MSRSRAKMGALLRIHNPSSGIHWWRSVGDFKWENDSGIKISIYSDVVISMTTWENIIMYTLAVKQLETDYSLCLHRNAPQFAHRFRPQNLFATLKKSLQSTRIADIDIFGMSLQAARKDERMRFGCRDIRINNQYKLHIPIFVLRSIKCIEQFGMGMNALFIRPGDFAKIQQIRTKISKGLEYSFYSYEIYEVAELLKTYFQMMPEGIFTDDLESRFLYTKELALSVRIRVLNLLVQVLPQTNREALFLLMGLLFRITHSPLAQVKSCILDHIFEPVLCRYNGNIVSERHGVIQVLIDHFPVVFGLQKRQLDAIYKQMNTLHPRKMYMHLKRRSMQCNDASSDILNTLKIFHASAQEQRKMVQNRGRTSNNLNTSSVGVPCPIRFNISPFATSAPIGRAEPAAPVGLAMPVRPAGPSSSIELTRLAGPYAPLGFARITLVPGSVGIFRPSESAAPMGRASLGKPSEPAKSAVFENHSHQRENNSN